MSVLLIESSIASIFKLTPSLSDIVLFSSDCSALLADEDDVVINVPDSLSIYCIWVGLDNAILKSDIDLVNWVFSIVKSPFVSSNLVCF